jgi:Sulfotransferase domain
VTLGAAGRWPAASPDGRAVMPGLAHTIDLVTGARRPALPDFVVIGASKSGTHWLGECLREHPDVYLTPDVHEIFFFDRHFDRGVRWYARYFRGWAGQRRIGDVTPTYLAHPLAPRRLHQVLPEATLLVSLRNPIDRAWSSYLHHWRKGDIAPATGFREACATVPGIVGDGEYHRCLERWRRYFTAERLHCLVLDDARADPFAYLRRVYELLGVAPEFEAEATTERTNEHATPRSLRAARIAFRGSRLLHRHGLHAGVEVGKALGLRRLVLQDGPDARRDPPPMSDEDRSWLAARYRDDLAGLSELIGRDLVRSWLART